MTEELKQIFIDYLAKRGIEMEKLISTRSHGLFSYKPATYDTRRVYTIQDMEELNKLGFSISEDAGLFILNIFFNL